MKSSKKLKQFRTNPLKQMCKNFMVISDLLILCAMFCNLVLHSNLDTSDQHQYCLGLKGGVVFDFVMLKTILYLVFWLLTFQKLTCCTKHIPWVNLF